MSWPIVKLDDVFKVARGGSPRPIQDFITDDPDGINWIMIGDTKDSSKYIKSTAKKIKREGMKKSREVFPGDFLLTNSMSFGKPYILKTQGCIHDGWLVLSPKHDQIHTDYFYHYLGSSEIKNKLASRAAGAVVKNLNSEIVRQLEIPLPPLAEQKRIAAILDKADAIRRKRQQAIALADEFLRSVFLDMFGDPVTNPKGLNLKPITSFASVITGNAFKSNDYIEDSENAVRLCRGANTLPGFFDWKDTAFWGKNRLNKLDNYRLKGGDTILAMDRPWISSGLKVCLWDEKERETYLVQRVARLRPKKMIYAEFIYACIKSQAFEKHCCPTETTVPHISPVELKEFLVPNPSEDLLLKFHQIVQKFSLSFKSTNTAEVNSESLFNALSQKAFAGQL
ncbi:MAG: restriction endonuclease subunit S [Thiolinea sp.]